MARPKQPATATIKKIRENLEYAPSYPSKIKADSGLHGNTVNDALKFLLSKGLIRKERNGHRMYYSLVTDNDGWGVPWVRLMRPKEQDAAIRKEVKEEWRKMDLKKELEKRVLEMRQNINGLAIKPENEALVKALIQIGQNKVAAKILKQNIDTPFCIACLVATKNFIPMIFDKETEEYYCPNCGVALDNTNF